MSLTVCIPVVMCRSSGSPKVTLTTLSKRKALPCWPLNWREMRASMEVRWAWHFWQPKMRFEERKSAWVMPMVGEAAERSEERRGD